MNQKGQFGTAENKIALQFVIFLIINIMINSLKIIFENKAMNADILIMSFALLLFVLYIVFVNVYKKELLFLLLYISSNLLIIFKISGDFSGLLMLLLTLFYATENKLINFFLFIFYACITIFCIMLNCYIQKYDISQLTNNIIFLVLGYFIIKNLYNFRGLQNEKNNNI